MAKLLLILIVVTAVTRGLSPQPEPPLLIDSQLSATSLDATN